MRSILAIDNQLVFQESEIPQISGTQCLVKVAYAGVNRADLLQKQGLYPPPKGESNILGLEFSGEIVEVGEDVIDFSKGDLVCSIVGSGAYAEYLKVEHTHLIRVPGNLDLEQAAALPEAFVTAYQSLVFLSDLQKDESILIHAGASGVGAAAIQMAKSIGAKVIVTASGGKHEFCYDLGADQCINYKEVEFDEVSPKVDVVLDLIGGSYFQGNINVLAVEGRMVMLGFLGGVKANEPNIAGIVTKRLRIEGSTLRARDTRYKAELIGGFVDRFLANDNFPFRTNVDKVFDFQETKAAHSYMEQNKNRGKILIKM
jgi:putative PIG3 family NAD(P)H quinone oxidoreductase